MKGDDLISRKATIAALDDLIQQYANTLKSLARKESWALPLVEEQLDGIKIAKDAVVAISADRVRDHLRELAMRWRARALNERAFGVDEDATPSLTCSQELVALIEQLIPPAAGVEEKIASVHATAYGLPVAAAARDVPKRPPMLLACCESKGNWHWYMHDTYMEKTMWVREMHGAFRSGNLLAVARDHSDPAALALYDADVKAP